MVYQAIFNPNKYIQLKWPSNTIFWIIGLGDDQPAEIKKPRKPVIFDLLPNFPARQITKIICGGMHTAALASNGSIYTWGNNDDKALGRQGAENVPLKVEIDFKANGVSAGDSCTIAYNTDSNQVFYWGCYKVCNFTKKILFFIFHTELQYGLLKMWLKESYHFEQEAKQAAFIKSICYFSYFWRFNL